MLEIKVKCTWKLYSHCATPPPLYTRLHCISTVPTAAVHIILYFVKNCPKIKTSLSSHKLNSSFVLNQRNGNCENEISSLSFSHTKKWMYVKIFFKMTWRKIFLKIWPPVCTHFFHRMNLFFINFGQYLANLTRVELYTLLCCSGMMAATARGVLVQIVALRLRSKSNPIRHKSSAA